jgi:hypothetical protein
VAQSCTRHSFSIVSRGSVTCSLQRSGESGSIRAGRATGGARGCDAGGALTPDVGAAVPVSAAGAGVTGPAPAGSRPAASGSAAAGRRAGILRMNESTAGLGRHCATNSSTWRLLLRCAAFSSSR